MGFIRQTKSATYKILLVCALVYSQSCDTEKQGLSDEMLVKIVADAQVLEAASNHLSGAMRDSISSCYYKALFKKYKLEKSEFEKMMDELAKNPVKAKRIYDIVSDSLLSQQKQPS